MIYRFFKRFFDILISLIALPFVLLVILIFAPIIYFTDRGPVFYNAERIGKNGKVFKMLKLRSMKVNSPNLKNADGSTYNGKDDILAVIILSVSWFTDAFRNEEKFEYSDLIELFENDLVTSFNVDGKLSINLTAYKPIKDENGKINSNTRRIR